MGQLGFQELLVIGAIAMLIFGGKKLPELGAGVGKAIRNFKSALNQPDSPPQEDVKEPGTEDAAKAKTS